MTAKTPIPVPTEDIKELLEKPDPEPETKEPTTVSDLAYEIAFLSKAIAKDAGIPLGTAVTIVKTTLEYQLNRDALKLDIARNGAGGPFIPPGAKPVALPADDTEEEE